MKLLAAVALAATLATPAAYVQAQQREDGGFGDAQMTAWATLGLVAAGAPTGAAAGYLARQQPPSATDAALIAMARAAAGDRPDDLLPRLRAHRPGKLVNATIWTLLALRQAGEPAPATLVRSLLKAQRPSGGWPWLAGAAADANDTAAAMQALRAAGVRGRPLQRGVVFLRRHQNPDGGFELTQGRGSDTQSTAWAIQALIAAGASPGPPAFGYLQRMRRPDGSYRYNARYVTTPLWVTAQVLPALARKPFPLATG
ncbi:MAG TPA: prenyltransferase/squalene oxidase repeat-containing protein [Gaiellaceae bacterium]|nr:prenyltransferase/squalene oxidase repeat-containing protein [Gaiellaceae bacterium]